MIHIKIDNVVNYILQIGKDGQGAFWDQQTVPPLKEQVFVWRYNSLHHAEARVYDNPINDDFINPIPPDCRWGVKYTYSIIDNGIKSEFVYVEAFHDINGKRWANSPYKFSELFESLLDSKFLEEERVNREQIMAQFTWPILVACAFMHCKNVQLIDEPLTRQRRRKLERKGGIRYKVLDIEPFKKQVRRETQPGESQLQRALHICRGHFATYTEDKPLFGKHVGTWWKPMHVRGNKSQGQVVKDYNIVLDNDSS